MAGVWEPGAGWKLLSHRFICGIWVERSKGSPHNPLLNIFKFTNQATKLLHKMFSLPTLTKCLLNSLEGQVYIRILELLGVSQTWQYLGSWLKAPWPWPISLFPHHPALHFRSLLSCTAGPGLLSVVTLGCMLELHSLPLSNNALCSLPRPRCSQGSNNRPGKAYVVFGSMFGLFE